MLGATAASRDNPLRETNSTFLVGAEGSILAQYDKQLLIPFSEYVPWEGTFDRLPLLLRRSYYSAIRKAWGYLPFGQAGGKMDLFLLSWSGGSVPFAAMTCWENVYPPLAAEARRMGARFGVHLTSEGEVGGVLHEHTLRACILRSVENRLPYVRDGNTGISCFIDSRGRITRRLERPGGGAASAGVLVDRVGLSEGPMTFYAWSHDAFDTICVSLGLGLLAWTLVRRRAGLALAIVLAAAGLSTGCGHALGADGDVAGPGPALESARSLVAKGQLEAAVADFRVACNDEATCRTALEPAAKILRAIDDSDRALSFLDEVIAAHPALDAEARGFRAIFLGRKRLYAESREEFRRALDHGASPRIRVLFGDLLWRGGEAHEAEEQYREAIRLGVGEPGVRARLGRTLRAQGRNEEAIQILEQVVAERPGLALAWLEIGRAHLHLGNPQRAEEAFRRAAEVDPKDIEARFMLAKLALRAERFDDAQRLTAEIRSIEATLGRGPRED